MDHGLPEVATERLAPASRFGLRAGLLAVALALVGAPFGWLLHEVTTHGALTKFDESAAQSLHRHFVHNRTAIDVLQAISFTGKPVFLFFVIGLPAAWLWWRGARKLVVFLLVASLGGSLVDTVVKSLVGRPRPKLHEPIATAFGKSFPSGHSMSSLICYGALLLVFLPLCARRWRPVVIAATVVWVLAVGFSRLALGVHFISDVLGGYALGGAWLVGSVAAFEVWREDRGRPRTKPLESGVEPEEAKAAARGD